ncbi:MAG: hypothetical protein ACE5GB_07400 [Acidimicrobiales bacterium]
MRSLAVLVVDAASGDDDPTVEVLAEAGVSRARVARVGSITEATAFFGPADIVLVHPTLPDAEGVAAVSRVVESFPGVPVVAITGHSDDADLMVAAGAEDHVPHDALAGPNAALIIERTIRHVIERTRLRRELEDRHRPSLEVAAFGVAHEDEAPSLSSRLPDAFEAMVADAASILADRSRTRRGPASDRLRVRALGAQLGYLHAGPADIAEVLEAAVSRSRRYVRASTRLEDLFLVDLMGYVMDHYRRATPAARGRV